MAAHIKKGDMIQIITGSHKGATGKVLRVIPEKNLVVIEGHNRKYKHVRPSKRNPQGGRIQIERPIHVSNVLPLNPKTSKGTRVHYDVGANGSKKRMAHDGTELGIVTR